MHRFGRELFPYDPEIECTFWKARRGKLISENQMEGGMDEVNHNVGEATGQRENNSQVLNPPRINSSFQEANQEHRALSDYVVPSVIHLVIKAPPIQANQFELKSILL